MKKAGGGSIINLGSREGINGTVGFSIYAATKEAIRGLSRARGMGIEVQYSRQCHLPSGTERGGG